MLVFDPVSFPTTLISPETVREPPPFTCNAFEWLEFTHTPHPEFTAPLPLTTNAFWADAFNA